MISFKALDLLMAYCGLCLKFHLQSYTKTVFFKWVPQFYLMNTLFFSSKLPRMRHQTKTKPAMT